MVGERVQWRKFTFSGGGGGAKPPKFPTKLSNFRHTPPFALEKTVFSPLLALFKISENSSIFREGGGGGLPPPALPRFPPLSVYDFYVRVVKDCKRNKWKHCTNMSSRLCTSQLKAQPPDPRAGLGINGEWPWINTGLMHHFPRGTG
jgi:hypothetical protein